MQFCNYPLIMRNERYCQSNFPLNKQALKFWNFWTIEKSDIKPI